MNESSAPGAARGPRAHDIGAHGLVVVAAESHDIRIRGVDGSEARVVAPADGAGVETAVDPGRFSVRTLRLGGRPGFVGIQIGSRGFGFPLGFGSSGTIELEVPRDARVEVHTSSGDVALRDVLGGVGVKTASGDVSLKRVARSVAVEAASGDVHVSAVEPVSLTARTVSGNVGARAPRFEHVAIETVSGDAELAGAFAPGPLHAVSTVSGDVDLAVAGGLTLEVKTISGDVDCSHPDRRSGDGRRHPLVVGDGAARFAVRSMSGDVDVRAARRAAPEGEDAGRESAGPSGVEGFALPPAPQLQVAQPPVSVRLYS